MMGSIILGCYNRHHIKSQNCYHENVVDESYDTHEPFRKNVHRQNYVEYAQKYQPQKGKTTQKVY